MDTPTNISTAEINNFLVRRLGEKEARNHGLYQHRN